MLAKREVSIYAYYPSVRLKAIELLDKKSLAVLEQLKNSEPDAQFSNAAKQRIEQLENNTGFFSKLFHTE